MQRLAAWRKAGGRPFDIAAMSVREVRFSKATFLLHSEYLHAVVP